MYNRYIPSGGTYTRVVEEDAPRHTPSPPKPPPVQPAPGRAAGLLRRLHLDGLDSGDLLLLALVLLLAAEGDDLDVLLTLGLLLLLGLEG